MRTKSEEKKTQFILDENGKLAEMPKEDAVPVEYPIKVPLKNAFEVFVRVKDTENYWISNYGRCETITGLLENFMSINREM